MPAEGKQKDLALSKAQAIRLPQQQCETALCHTTVHNETLKSWIRHSKSTVPGVCDVHCTCVTQYRQDCIGGELPSKYVLHYKELKQRVTTVLQYAFHSISQVLTVLLWWGRS